METTPEHAAPIFRVGPDQEPLYRDRPLSGLLDQGFEQVWGLLVDGVPTRALPPAEPFPLPVRTGDTRVDVQSAIAQLAPIWGFRPIVDISPKRAREDLARASVLTLSFVAQSARGPDLPAVPQRTVDQGRTAAERFLIRWSGAPRPDHAAALDALWTIIAEHGPTLPSTRIARIAAGNGADLGACLSAAISGISGALAAGSIARARTLAIEVHDGRDAADVVRQALGEHVEVPTLGPTGLDRRTELLREVCRRLDVRLFAAADALERVTIEEAGLPARATAALWGAVLLDHIGFEPRLFNALIICGRTAGWSAHILDTQRELMS